MSPAAGSESCFRKPPPPLPPSPHCKIPDSAGMKIPFRKWLILTHRYLGIPLSFLFLMWFASGIVMIFARGMPSLTPDLRLQRLPALDLSAVRLSPAAALEKAQFDGVPFRAILLTILGRPAYRFSSRRGSVTVFAD